MASPLDRATGRCGSPAASTIRQRWGGGPRLSLSRSDLLKTESADPKLRDLRASPPPARRAEFTQCRCRSPEAIHSGAPARAAEFGRLAPIRREGGVRWSGVPGGGGSRAEWCRYYESPSHFEGGVGVGGGESEAAVPQIEARRCRRISISPAPRRRIQITTLRRSRRQPAHPSRGQPHTPAPSTRPLPFGLRPSPQPRPPMAPPFRQGSWRQARAVRHGRPSQSAPSRTRQSGTSV